jgi:cytoskeletal protein RodZ
MQKDVLLAIGKDLKKRRLEQKIKIEDLARKMHLNKDYIRAIEVGDTESLKFDAYTVGYVKKYASELGLDPNDYVKTMSGAVQDVDLPPVASKDLITGKDFLPSPQVIISSTLVLVVFYIMIEILV